MFQTRSHLLSVNLTQLSRLLPFVKRLCLGFFFSLHFLATFSKEKLILLFSTPIYNVSRSFIFISLAWQAFLVSPSLQISLLLDLLLLLGDLWKYCIRADLAHVPGSVLLDTPAEMTWRVVEEVMMVFIPVASTIWIKWLDRIKQV